MSPILPPCENVEYVPLQCADGLFHNTPFFFPVPEDDERRHTGDGILVGKSINPPACTINSVETDPLRRNPGQVGNLQESGHLTLAVAAPGPEDHQEFGICVRKTEKLNHVGGDLCRVVGDGEVAVFRFHHEGTVDRSEFHRLGRRQSLPGAGTRRKEEREDDQDGIVRGTGHVDFPDLSAILSPPAKVSNPRSKHNRRRTMTTPLDRRYDVQDLSTIDVNALETFAYEHPGKDIVMAIDTDEFTAVCPWSGLPDFATIRIEYIPRKVCIELRSLKYYLLSYRNVGIYQEHLVNRILDDLVRCAHPKWMKVAADYRIRGGVHTVAAREYPHRQARRS